VETILTLPVFKFLNKYIQIYVGVEKHKKVHEKAFKQTSPYIAVMEKWRNPKMSEEIRERVVVKTDGRITIPLNLRKYLDIEENSYLQLETYKGKVLMSRLVK
jgi:AbrB family looped-hinge helix DNA binding protein